MSTLRDLLILFGFLLIILSHVSQANDDERSTTKSIESILSEASVRMQQITNETLARIQQTANELQRDEEELEKDRKKLEEEKTFHRLINKTDIIRLNVGGEILLTTRQTLISLPKSLFSVLFNGRWEHKLQNDGYENIFIDFNVIVFRHLLDQLQLSHLDTISPPSDPSLAIPFGKMIRKLQLQDILSSEKNILTINAGGETVTSQRASILTMNKIVESLNQSKTIDQSDLFVDHHPKSFRHLIKLRRENKPFQIQCQNHSNMSCSKQTSDVTMPDITLKKVLADLTHQSKQSEDNIDQMQTQMKNLQQNLTMVTNKHEEHLNKIDANDQNQFLQINQSREKVQLIDNRLTKLIKRINSIHGKWKQDAKTIAGGNGIGDKLNQLIIPYGIYINDQQQPIYIADSGNHRIVQWKFGANNGQIVAGGNGKGNRIDQLNWPTDVIVDQNNKSLIICDRGNSRVVRWSLENQQDKQIIIENIGCWGLMMNENGDLFVSDVEKHEVKRWRKGAKEGTVVAGGNGEGDQRNQLDEPTYLFIDRQETVYVSDWENHRVMKWVKGAKEGIVVAGGQGEGDSLTQLSYPQGLIVNEAGDVYVADLGNARIMCWSVGSAEGRVVVGGNGEGQGSNQLHDPRDLSFDVENNLYVVDSWNLRIQRFSVDQN